MRNFKIVAAIVAACLVFSSWTVGGCWAQETADRQLPEDPQVWLNSPPITNKILEGKGAVLYFFEEG